ncbi:hypothetical protein HY626_04030 [Candidatus Uhrbacteria bacterium]|nr:hypothetical protein [Candidatus Uhrbacteria bacterium]
MSVRLLDGVFSEGFETLIALVRDGRFTTELADRIRGKDGLNRAFGALYREFFPTEEPVRPIPPVDDTKNPYELPLEVQLAALWRANDEEGWGIEEEVFARLAETAPAWPKGRLAFRSFRIRFGEGDEGVARTFEAHAKRVNTVFGAKFWRWDFLLSGKHPFEGNPVDRLRLLIGNHTHKPVVEWVTFDLDANRERQSITAVRGPKSLADELFVFAWMFTDYVRDINYETNPGLFAGGYELNVPERGDDPWQYVPCVDWYRDDAEVRLSASWRSDDNSGYSVPVLRE